LLYSEAVKTSDTITFSDYFEMSDSSSPFHVAYQ